MPPPPLGCPSPCPAFALPRRIAGGARLVAGLGRRGASFLPSWGGPGASRSHPTSSFTFIVSSGLVPRARPLTSGPCTVERFARVHVADNERLRMPLLLGRPCRRLGPVFSLLFPSFPPCACACVMLDAVLEPPSRKAKKKEGGPYRVPIGPLGGPVWGPYRGPCRDPIGAPIWPL